MRLGNETLNEYMRLGNETLNASETVRKAVDGVSLGLL
jgi:hypothetical protein